MTEYWLQKKTIGGWSHVTWYDNPEQAKRNFDNCSKDNNGYSWRLVKVETVEVKMLEEVVTVEAPKVEIAAKANVWAGNEVKVTADASGWGKPTNGDWSSKNDWANTSESPQALGWGNTSKELLPEKMIINEAVNMMTRTHGLVGKVWLINHQLKQKKRVDPADVDSMIAQGWVRGGPKTSFQ